MSTGKGSIKLCENQVLTGSFVDTTVPSYSITEESIATVDVLYTTGAAETNNSMQFQLSFSYDGETWVTETYASLATGTNTLAPLEHSIAGASAGTEYKAQYVVPFCSRHLKVQVKETGVSANYGTATIILTVAAASGQERNLQATNVTVTGVATAANQLLEIAELQTLNSLVPSVYDYIGLTNDGSGNPTSVVFKHGGASGTVVSTLTLVYDGSGNLTSVTKS